MDERIATRRAWQYEYIGDTPILLLDTINEMNATRLKQKPPPSYANFLAIVQSSGTGKSRTVDELAKLLFTIPFNLRDDQQSGFPPADSIQIQFVSPGATIERARSFYFNFFQQLFVRIKDILKDFETAASHNELALKWYQYLSQSEEGLANRQRVYEAAMYGSSSSTLTTRDQHGSGPSAANPQVLLLLKAASDLVDLIKSKVKGENKQCDDVHLLLYFDEAHCLASKMVPWGGEYSLYHGLCSVLDVLKTLPMFTIFMSTNSNLWNVRRALFDPLQTPFTELPFDCHPEIKGLVKSGELTLDDVSAPGFMVKFGRPLFWTRWSCFGLSADRDIIDFAQLKLCLQNPYLENNPRLHYQISELEKSRRLWTYQVAFAALSQRALLEFKPSLEFTRRMEQEQVECYMRYVFTVPSHREYLLSGAPSEPILAEAAALIMSRVEDEDIIKSVVAFAEHDIIGKDEGGHLVARLLLTLAHDKAINSYYPKVYPKPFSFSFPIPLMEFLGSLFSDAKMNLIQNSYPDNQRNGLRFADVFDNAFIRFTHFVKATDDRLLTAVAAFSGLARGFAFQFADQQVDIDIVIPIHLGGRSVKLSKANTTAMLICVRNRSRKFIGREPLIDEADLGFFPKTEDDAASGLPYIVVIMELGAEEITDAPETMGEEEMSDTIPVKQSLHPRYTIRAFGCSTGTYKVAQPTGFQQLLAHHTVLNDHSRQAAANLTALKRAKPFWNDGPDCYDWTDDDYLNTPKENN